MLIFLLLLFNWFLLLLTMSNIWSLFQPVHTLQQVLIGLISLGVVLGLCGFFYSSAGQWLLRLLSGGRPAIGRERARLLPIIERVQAAVEGLGYARLPLRLMVIDEPLPNALALGRHTLIVTRGLYESCRDEEIAGVIAHELGHLQAGDSQRLGIAVGVSLVSLSIAAVGAFLQRFLGGFGRGGDDIGAFWAVVGWVLFLFMLAFVLLAKLGQGLFQVLLLVQGRRLEYRADAFAVKAGFGPGLLTFLERLSGLDWEGPRGILQRLVASHPATMLRIGKVEQLLASESAVMALPEETRTLTPI